MRTLSRRLVRQALTLMAGLLVLKVTAAVVAGYANYFPPDFHSDFLRGRDLYFFGGYRWAFYPHIVVGPVTLVLGMVLLSDGFRSRFPKLHRRLGRVQVACVLLVVTPSGLVMAWHAASGPVAGIGFALLSVLTGTCVALGWRAAVQRRFSTHRRWMWRCFLLLSSAVVLRILGGLATVLGVTAAWFDPVASWCSWILPLAAFELSGFLHRRAALRVVDTAVAAQPRKV